MSVSHSIPRTKLLLFLISGDHVMAACFSRFAHALSMSLNADVTTISEIRSGQKVRSAVGLFGKTDFVNLIYKLPNGIFNNLHRLFYYALSVNSGASLIKLAISGIPVGVHIYDSMLRRDGLASIEKLSLKQRFYVLMEIIYYFTVKSLIQKYKPSAIILPDNTYRQGTLFEYLQKEWSGDLFVGIDMNSLTVHRYKCPVNISRHCRTPRFELIERLKSDPESLRYAKLYFETRKSGRQAQHDVMRAYDPTKSMTSKVGLQNTFGLDARKKIVLVMAHVFSDAPHAYPETIFQDYRHWLISTCLMLNANPNIEFLIKEHPSSSLYDEEGKIETILEKLSFKDKILKKDINTASLFSAVDYIVTCGGTAAMEFAAEGVPVVAASKPPYWEMGFCTVATSLDHYESILANIHEMIPLNEVARANALLSLYVINYLYGLDRKIAGFGSQNIFKGAKFSEELFFDELKLSGPGSPEFSYLVETIGGFINSDETNLIASSKYTFE